MVARVASPDDSTSGSTEAEQLRVAREAAAVLDHLLKILFSKPPSLDMITVENIVTRYPRSGLGRPAVAAIEQSQRIVGARDDYSQVGLGEFHIGLIYLHWNDCRAAANQFAATRQLWTLAADAPAMCLSHYAQGLGLHFSHHNEAAMLQFGRAERLLDRRPALGAQAGRFNALSVELRPLLKIAQEIARKKMWPREQPTAETPQADYTSAPPDASPGEPEPANASETRQPFEQPSDPTESAKEVPRPISNLLLRLGGILHSPVPGHTTTDDRLGWYRIAEKTGGFLPTVASGTWILADRDVGERLMSGWDWVVVGSRQPGLGGIAVKPISHPNAAPYCYLGYRIPDESTPSGAQLFLDETDRPSATDDVSVLAVVEGLWYDPKDGSLPIG